MNANLLLAEDTTLLDVVDRLLERGVVVVGDVILSVADVDLVYLGLRAILCGISDGHIGHSEFGVRGSEFGEDGRNRRGAACCSRSTYAPETGGASSSPTTPNSEFRTPNPEESGIGHQASGIGHQASGIGHQASGIGHPTSGIGHQASDTHHLPSEALAKEDPTSSFALRATEDKSDIRHRTPTIGLDPERVQNGLAKLVLTLVEFIRQVLERQALRRMENGTLSDEEIERLGLTFFRLQEKVGELKEFFGLTDEELNLNLGPLGDLM